MVKNPNLNKMQSDFLYHININIPDTCDTKEIQQKFGDVKFVCMGGTKVRMLTFAKFIRNLILPKLNDADLIDISEAGNRYAMYKVGPVLCCSHGIGISSMSVLLHELIKLVNYAKCQDPIFIRIGTSGGVGVDPGTVVVAEDGYNGYLKNEYELAILGKRVIRPAIFDRSVGEALSKCIEPEDKFQVIRGSTLGAECFYEGQGRLDGASAEYCETDKMSFLQECHKKGIRNIEMEAPMFASLTHHVGIKATDVCVTLLNRLNGDQITITKEQKEEFEQRPLTIVGRYIQKVIGQL